MEFDTRWQKGIVSKTLAGLYVKSDAHFPTTNDQSHREQIQIAANNKNSVFGLPHFIHAHSHLPQSLWVTCEAQSSGRTDT